LTRIDVTNGNRLGISIAQEILEVHRSAVTACPDESHSNPFAGRHGSGRTQR
jgi:hypothetical protein